MNSFNAWQAFGGAALALLFVFALQSILAGVARKQSGCNRKVGFMDLVITCEDDSYSLSRLQIYLWTITILMAFTAFFFATHRLPEIPTNLYILMGLNVAASVTSTAIYNIKAKTNAASPTTTNKTAHFIKDIFFESEESLDLPRTQMFIWTIVLLLAFIAIFIKDISTARNMNDIKSLPDLPIGLIALMGISNGAYIGMKAVSK